MVVRVQTMPRTTHSGVVRWYENDTAGPMDDYSWVCMINWDDTCPDKDVWVHGLKGEVSRKSLRQFLSKLDEMGFKRVRALRKEGRHLPKATEMPDGSFAMLVAHLKEL